VLDEVDPAAILYLINAIYFKGTWTHEFDKADTRDRPFYLVGGGQKNVPMMELADTLRYYRGDGFQGVSLPYGNGRFSMYVFLPDENSSLSAFHANLTPENWQAWMDRFERAEGTVILPKFKIEYMKQLNGQLTALGMGVAFDPDGANFRKMLPLPQGEYYNACISFVLHKTFVEVNEEGTEAAAVTVVGVVGITSIGPPHPEPFYFKADRPFFYAIRDNQSGTILFMGSVVDPAS
jgi:serpin B